MPEPITRSNSAGLRTAQSSEARVEATSAAATSPGRCRPTAALSSHRTSSTISTQSCAMMSCRFSKCRYSAGGVTPTSFAMAAIVSLLRPCCPAS